MLDDTNPTARIGDWADEPDSDVVELFCPRLRTRVTARLRRLELDRKLADGADPSSCALLAARAAQLVRRGTRLQIAGALDRAVKSVDAGSARGRTLPAREAIRRNRAELIALSAELCRDRATYAQGLALLELVIVDGTGPVYTDRTGRRLERELQRVRRGLVGCA